MNFENNKSNAISFFQMAHEGDNSEPCILAQSRDDEQRP